MSNSLSPTELHQSGSYDLSTRLAKLPPDHIFVEQDSDGFWTCREAISGSPKYIRADLVPSPTEPSRRETVGVTEEMIEAAARSDAAFDGRPIETLGRVERDRYRARAHRALNAALARTSPEGGVRVATAEEEASRFQRAWMAAEKRAQRITAALTEIIDYSGGAANALEDPYVMERARAAVEVPLASPPTAGEDADGWRLVPIVATERMLDAGHDALSDSLPTNRESGRDCHPNDLDDPNWLGANSGLPHPVWKAMLDAAPSPPSPTASKGGK